MAKKKRVPVKTLSRSLNLDRYVDFEEESKNFDLPVKRVAQIAREVENAGGHVFQVSVTQSESELRDRLEAIYSEEVRKLQTCPVDNCQEEITDIHHFVAHQRIHLATQSPDPRVRASVLRDIERVLVPTVEKHLGLNGALPPEERARITEALRNHGLIPASLDSGHEEKQH